MCTTKKAAICTDASPAARKSKQIRLVEYSPAFLVNTVDRPGLPSRIASSHLPANLWKMQEVPGLWPAGLQVG